MIEKGVRFYYITLLSEVPEMTIPRIELSQNYPREKHFQPKSFKMRTKLQHILKF